MPTLFLFLFTQKKKREKRRAEVLGRFSKYRKIPRKGLPFQH
jgi:hypothetical protein